MAKALFRPDELTVVMEKAIINAPPNFSQQADPVAVEAETETF